MGLPFWTPCRRQRSERVCAVGHYGAGPLAAARIWAPQYTNVVYPFPMDLPHVPEENPTGEYRRSITVPESWQGGRILLRFDGVDSCARVSLDGSQIGVTAGSRLPVEFDITDRLEPGVSHELVVRVHQWSAGSYVEDQDMWWLSGIFRPVTLLHRPDDSINDFWLHADFDPATGAGHIAVELDAAAVVLEIPELGIATELPPGEKFGIDCGTVEPWSSERPRLYAGTLRSAGESIAVRLGFRRVQVRDGQIRVNDNPVLFRGVNRHEWDPRTGRAIDAATMAADVSLMKANNFNAVRTAHYPPHPIFWRYAMRPDSMSSMSATSKHTVTWWMNTPQHRRTLCWRPNGCSHSLTACNGWWSGIKTIPASSCGPPGTNLARARQRTPCWNGPGAGIPHGCGSTRGQVLQARRRVFTHVHPAHQSGGHW
ncbi:glycoside hydrolase family 2 TIM barrel-domain containing protein [Arthrobacter alpinus]|nr:glycoside hydrolase family 2 TIM barrel-domain containing protein [Arthrobacter alpinus]